MTKGVIELSGYELNTGMKARTNYSGIAEIRRTTSWYRAIQMSSRYAGRQAALHKAQAAR